jgi:hypothetical protein
MNVSYWLQNRWRYAGAIARLNRRPNIGRQPNFSPATKSLLASLNKHRNAPILQSPIMEPMPSPPASHTSSSIPPTIGTQSTFAMASLSLSSRRDTTTSSRTSALQQQQQSQLHHRPHDE